MLGYLLFNDFPHTVEQDPHDPDMYTVTMSPQHIHTAIKVLSPDGAPAENTPEFYEIQQSLLRQTATWLRNQAVLADQLADTTRERH